MRKLLTLCLVLIAMASCEENNYVTRPTTTTSPDNMSRRIIDLQVDERDWKYSNKPDNNYYFATFNIPELTKEVYDNGIISIYVEYQNPDGTYTMGLMPAVYHKEEFDQEGNQILYTLTLDAEYSVGQVTVIATSSDFFQQNPGSYHFVLKMLW